MMSVQYGTREASQNYTVAHERIENSVLPRAMTDQEMTNIPSIARALLLEQRENKCQVFERPTASSPAFRIWFGLGQRAWKYEVDVMRRSRW